VDHVVHDLTHWWELPPADSPDSITKSAYLDIQLDKDHSFRL
jgi:hypothetical protein